MSYAAKDSVSNKWFPAINAHLLNVKRSYLIKMLEGVEIEKHNTLSHTNKEECVAYQKPKRLQILIKIDQSVTLSYQPKFEL